MNAVTAALSESWRRQALAVKGSPSGVATGAERFDDESVFDGIVHAGGNDDAR